MASHYKWYPSTSDTIVPWNARYEYPSEANKATKMTPRIPPKNGSTFIAGNTVRLEFPAQGYVNPANFTIEFDVTLKMTGSTSDVALAQFALYLQNNVQSVFTRGRLMYGATPIEDIIGMNFLVRQLTEWTTSPGSYMDQTSISQGIAGVQVWEASATDEGNLINARKYLHGILKNKDVDGGKFPPDRATTTAAVYPSGTTTANNRTATRRYQIQMPFGLFTQSKYIPVKFMASQLAIELTLAPNAQCLIYNPFTCFAATAVQDTAITCSYELTNVNMIPEVLEFDASYDEQFLQGLQKGGVPIAFSSWHNYPYPQGGSTLNNIVIQEKSRSVKAIFAMLKLSVDRLCDDMGATFAGLGGSPGTIESYQYRIGSRFYPASPVICSSWESGGGHNGACEAYIELQKCLNTLGDARLSTALNAERWAMPLIPTTTLTRTPTAFPGSSATPTEVVPAFVNCADGLMMPTRSTRDSLGNFSGATPACNGYSTATLSSVFCMATCLETTNGREISGLNAEEQSDITLLVKFSSINTASRGATFTFNYEIYTYYDAMLVLRENNVLELIT